MDKFMFEYLKNAIQFVNSPTFPQLIKSLPSPETMKTPINNASMASKLTLSPEAIKALNNTKNLYVSLNIGQLNTTLPKLTLSTETIKVLNNISLDIAQLSTAFQKMDSLPKADFQKIKNIVYENHSQIYDAVHDTVETVSSNIEQSDQNNNNETLIMSEQVAELVNTIDNSVKFSQPYSDNQIHIKKSDTNYFNIIAILIALAQFFYSIYESNASTELSKQNYAELIQEEYQQTQELKQQTQEELKQTQEMLKQTQEEQKQTKILEKMLNSNDTSVSLSTPSTPHKD